MQFVKVSGWFADMNITYLPVIFKWVSLTSLWKRHALHQLRFLKLMFAWHGLQELPVARISAFIHTSFHNFCFLMATTAIRLTGDKSHPEMLSDEGQDLTDPYNTKRGSCIQHSMWVWKSIHGRDRRNVETMSSWTQMSSQKCRQERQPSSAYCSNRTWSSGGRPQRRTVGKRKIKENLTIRAHVNNHLNLDAGAFLDFNWSPPQ